MSGNIFGGVFRVVTFGESHGPAVGCVVEGCPAGVSLCTEDIARDLRRRRPGSKLPGASAREEADEPEILSGLFEGKTLGTPVAIIIRNKDQRPEDYDELKGLYRPGHADWTWEAKYGFRDHRGGGRSSGRETAGRVAAGAVAKAFLALQGCERKASGGTKESSCLPDKAEACGISIKAWVSRMAGIENGEEGIEAGLEQRLADLAEKGDSAGGIISCRVSGLPPGLGEPVFGKLCARLGEAVLSIGACKGIEFGEGFAAAAMTGSEHNDAPIIPPSEAMAAGKNGGAFRTNRAGGSLGGISTGMDLLFRAAFKPPASIRLPQTTVDSGGAAREIGIRGRHDLAVLPRALPVVEAMTALVLADLLLQQRSARV